MLIVIAFVPAAAAAACASTPARPDGPCLRVVARIAFMAHDWQPVHFRIARCAAGLRASPQASGMDDSFVWSAFCRGGMHTGLKVRSSASINQVANGGTRIYHQVEDGSIWEIAATRPFFGQPTVSGQQLLVPANEVLYGTPIV
ncbi:hypothetical protein C8R45DRAFT_1108012 [Mycena sanguinolenta]|nr:hypothetical protein C8R45DRAFT_1108012 [Mycena sanguinolenta]